MLLDGNPFDIATIIVALLAVFIKPTKRRWSNQLPAFNFRDAVVDFLNGTVIVPFLLLIGSVFSKHILAEALATNKVALAYGGVIGLFFIFRELT
jgi:uncharacterized membrane protein YdcZ (DUF606 family)